MEIAVLNFPCTSESDNVLPLSSMGCTLVQILVVEHVCYI